MLEIASNDISSSLLTQAKQCLTDKTALKIEGNNSRPKIANDQPVVVSLKEHTGVIQYEPSELVIKVRAGTPVTQIQTLLKQNNQQLGTDFPDYGNSTFGGAIATGQTGSGRPFLGAIRDQVLGLGIINGQAQALNFGGQVMKNVAGYDVSRLLCGSAGKYAIITDVTLKVVPLKNNITVELDAKADALTTIN
ncbi:MAG: FAD-binding protein, partial [Gammaproteobacteria bacterium]|nr:FAD-binding protein [Gammaproteobacteria bacterium]